MWSLFLSNWFWWPFRFAGGSRGTHMSLHSVLKLKWKWFQFLCLFKVTKDHSWFLLGVKQNVYWSQSIEPSKSETCWLGFSNILRCWGLCAEVLLWSSLEINAYGRVKDTGLGRGRSRAVEEAQQRPQPNLWEILELWEVCRVVPPWGECLFTCSSPEISHRMCVVHREDL